MTVVVDWVQAHLGFLPPQILVVIVSMLPVVELRGGIPLARLLMLPLWQAIVFSAIGNILPIPFILLFVEKVFDWLRPTKLFGPLVEKLEKRALSKSDGIKKAEFWGLALFVGIPLPGTGGWTGSLAASLLKIDIKKASLAILLGIAIASTIMSLISYGVFAM
ncbi:MAG: small multi-drug export protein [Lachnospiraceae bacterium]|nr:small multi-drug export protein [Lachnospiraceae bacterium]